MIVEPSLDERVLVLAPGGRDAMLTCDLLSQAGLSGTGCTGVEDLCVKLAEGAGAVVAAEESLWGPQAQPLSTLLRSQPPWSDVPMIVLAAVRGGGPDLRMLGALAEQANVMLLERPLRPWTILSALRSALRARRRQYQVRDAMAERQRTAEELASAHQSAQKARELAERANRTKDHFLAMLSHELRTPLTPVLGAVGMLQDDPGLDEETQDALEVIRRNAELESLLIDDLLDVTRIAQGKVELHRRQVDVADVIRQAVEVCRAEIEARKLTLTTDIGPDAPYVIDADPARLLQVFWNLLKNSVKFTPPGGWVRMKCRRGDAFIEAQVSDSGIGIEPDVMARLFRPFEQGERTTTRRFGGLGLGLAISKAMVELHGGAISAHSDGMGKGATFQVSLPIGTQAGASVPKDVPPAIDTKALRPLRVLLVEDHGDTAMIMSRLLSRNGHAVQTAGSVAAALEAAGREQFDLLLSDLGLPDASGLDLVRELRRRGCMVPAVAISGHGHDEDIQRSHDAGFAQHLTKPVTTQRLLDVVVTVGTAMRT